MNRFLNRLPTITIREGHRVKVYLTSDLSCPRIGMRQATSSSEQEESVMMRRIVVELVLSCLATHARAARSSP